MNPNFGYNLGSGPSVPPLSLQPPIPQSLHPVPANSPPSQSVPGRRTPLGTFGLLKHANLRDSI